MVKKQRKALSLIDINVEGLPGKAASRKETRPMATAYAVARRSKPKECAKVAGRPWSVTVREGASDGRALRAKRCSHEKRQCARCARVNTSSVVVATGDGAGVAPKVKTTVSLRTTLSHFRRMRQRGQSFHNNGARGGSFNAFSSGGEEVETSEESGQNTALTRRGLMVVRLS